MSDETLSVPTENGIYGSVGEEAYHSDRGSLSCSGAKLLLPPSCPAKFRWVQENPPKPKRVYDFGHLAHKQVLGKGADIMEIDAPDYRTKAAQEAKAKAHANGKIPALSCEIEKANAMTRKVFEHPIAGKWFNPEEGSAEISVYADDPITEVRLRMRADWLWTGAADDRLFCIEYKTSTTANPDELIRNFWQLNYFMQGHWYWWLLQLADIADNPAHCFVVQEKEPPYLVEVIEYDAEAMAEGARRNREAIDLYARCRERNEWPSYTDGGITSISLPPYGFRQQTIDDLLDEVDE